MIDGSVVFLPEENHTWDLDWFYRSVSFFCGLTDVVGFAAEVGLFVGVLVGGDVEVGYCVGGDEGGGLGVVAQV